VPGVVPCKNLNEKYGSIALQAYSCNGIGRAHYKYTLIMAGEGSIAKKMYAVLWFCFMKHPPQSHVTKFSRYWGWISKLIPSFTAQGITEATRE